MIQRHERLIYLSSGMHLQGDPDLRDYSQDMGRYSYSDSKLHDVILSMAVSNDKEAEVSGRYFFHMREKPFLPVAGDPDVQEKFLHLCEQISSVGFPED